MLYPLNHVPSYLFEYNTSGQIKPAIFKNLAIGSINLKLFLGAWAARSKQPRMPKIGRSRLLADLIGQTNQSISID
jgi:hypothetical protein